jgi:hypothetical protein
MQYYYRIRHKNTGMVYVGCQYGRNADPSLFFRKYFTSSKTIHQLIMEDGKDSFEVVKVVEMKDARMFEHKVLRYCYRKLGKDTFIKKFYNRNIAPGILLDEDSILRANSESKRQKMIEIANKRVSEGTHNFLIPYERTEYHKELCRQKQIGNRYAAGRVLTDEQKQHAAEKSKGNTNVRGKFWWNNGTHMKRSIDCPGEGWIKGALKHSEETKKKRSNSLKNRTLSRETKQKMSEAKKRIDVK